ncbi:MAG: MFS transporter [Caulobacteraceae bacterium]
MSEPSVPGKPALLAFCGPCLPLAAIGLPLVVHLPAYYAGRIGLPLASVGVAFTFVRLLDIGFDPLLGAAMDATRTRFGRFRLWLVLSAPVLMAGAFMLFMARPGAGVAWLWAALFVVYVGFSMGSLAQQAWASALSADYHQRSRIYGWWQAGNVAGMILVLMLPPIVQLGLHGDQAAGVQAMGWFVIALLPLTIALAVRQVGEPVDTPRGRAPSVAEIAALMARPTVARLILTDLLLGWAPGVTGILFFFYFDQIKHIPESTANLLILASSCRAWRSAPSGRFWRGGSASIGAGRLGPGPDRRRAAGDGGPVPDAGLGRGRDRGGGRVLLRRAPAPARHDGRRGGRAAARHRPGPDGPALCDADLHHQDRHGPGGAELRGFGLGRVPPRGPQRPGRPRLPAGAVHRRAVRAEPRGRGGDRAPPPGHAPPCEILAALALKAAEPAR